MTLQAVATIVAGILTSVVLVGAATSAAVKLWRYRVVRILSAPVTISLTALWLAWANRRRELFDEKVVVAVAEDERIAGIIREVTGEVIEEQMGRLFQPNGGASLHDLSQRFTEVEKRLGIKNRHTDDSQYVEDPHLPIDRRKEI